MSDSAHSGDNAPEAQQAEMEAPEGQEEAAEENAEEDMLGDEAPEGDGDWNEAIGQMEGMHIVLASHPCTRVLHRQ